MNRSLLKIPLKVAGYKLSQGLNLKPPLPINVTFSVTNLCNSRCKTCFIWKLYHDHPELKEGEFKIWEFERTFQSLGKNPIWFTFSGGEPYLRHDIVEICSAAYEFCSSKIITIPTNALLPELVEEKTKRILEQCSDVRIIVNLSLDGVGEKHDKIRGVEGNFYRVLETFHRLKRLKKELPNLNIGVHSVISRYNINNILQLYEFVKMLNPDSYISEIAEKRTELFNMSSDITPDLILYNETINIISKKIKKDYLESKEFFQKVIQAFRITYYQAITQKPQIQVKSVPCYAGYASCHITPYGDIWPCCILGYDKPMGNLREVDYNFKKVWYSEKARAVRNYIKGENCACPLANAHYTNILCNFREILKVLRFLMSF